MAKSDAARLSIHSEETFELCHKLITMQILRNDIPG